MDKAWLYKALWLINQMSQKLNNEKQKIYKEKQENLKL